MDVATPACDMTLAVITSDAITTTLVTPLLDAKSLHAGLLSFANQRKDMKPIEATIHMVVRINTPAWNLPSLARID